MLIDSQYYRGGVGGVGGFVSLLGRVGLSSSWVQRRVK